MSVQRIREIMEKMSRNTAKEQREFMTNEAIKLSQADMQRFQKMTVPDRQKILQHLGKVDTHAQAAQDSYNDFFNQDGAHPEVDMNTDGHQFTGDEDFNKLYSGIENEEDLADFFNALHDASLKVGTNFKFNDVKVNRNDHIVAHLQYVSDTEFTTKRGEFMFKVRSNGNGACRVESVDLDGWLSTKHGNDVQTFLQELNTNSKAIAVLRSPINNTLGAPKVAHLK